ncbi:MAG TPA: hypothetical protein VGC47_00250 [Acidimicrobiia bacterium]|jgi:hypothetical protein
MRRITTVLSVITLFLLALPQAALAGSKEKQPIIEFATEQEVTGSFSMLDRQSDGVATKIRTRVTGGNAYTAWYVIFNNPDDCSGDCGEDDIFNADGSPNFETINAARISVVWTKTGGVANPAGRLALNGGLGVGEVPNGGPGIKVVIGLPSDGALVPSPVTGLETTAAEIHLVIQDHGPAHSDPALLELQTTSFMGACNPDCVDIQFAVHK